MAVASKGRRDNVADTVAPMSTAYNRVVRVQIVSAKSSMAQWGSARSLSC